MPDRGGRRDLLLAPLQLRKHSWVRNRSQRLGQYARIEEVAGAHRATSLPGERSLTSPQISSGSTWRPLRSTFFRRSEEHTSELQSRGHLVCRLLLEKKKKQ